MPADKLVDSIFRALSCTDGNNSNGNGSSSNGNNDNEVGGINVPGTVDGGGDTRAALKELVGRPALLFLVLMSRSLVRHISSVCYA